jgi:hypothetical protein
MQVLVQGVVTRAMPVLFVTIFYPGKNDFYRTSF